MLTRPWAHVARNASLAVMCVAVLVVGARVSQRTYRGQMWDWRAAHTLLTHDLTATRHVFGLLININTRTVAVVTVALVVVALLRRRWAAAVAAVAIVGIANVAAQAFKALYPRADFGMTTNPSYPSGHETVVVSLVLAALTVAPVALRPVVTFVGTAAVIVVASLLLYAGWHRPSDVLAAMLVGLATGALVQAVWSALLPREPETRRSFVHTLLGALGAVIAALAVVLLGVRPSGGTATFGQAAMVLVVVGLCGAVAVVSYAALGVVGRRDGVGVGVVGRRDGVSVRR